MRRRREVLGSRPQLVGTIREDAAVMAPRTWIWLAVLALAACGGDDGGGDPDANNPTDVPFGTTAIIVVVNPIVNDANTKTGLPTPGTVREGVTLTTDDNVTATTGLDGVAVLAPVTPGNRVITVSGAVPGGTFSVMVAATTLREVALAATPGSAQIMVNVDYRSDQAFEVVPTMTNAEVNSALAVSDRVVFVRGGTYSGDLTFAGSRVTLFGEGVLGGEVFLSGNITVSGSDSRIRGADLSGTVTITASKVGLSFSKTSGAVSSSGSDSMFLHNQLCGTETLTGSGVTVVGNIGTAPASACP